MSKIPLSCPQKRKKQKLANLRAVVEDGVLVGVGDELVGIDDELVCAAEMVVDAVVIAGVVEVDIYGVLAVVFISDLVVVIAAGFVVAIDGVVIGWQTVPFPM